MATVIAEVKPTTNRVWEDMKMREVQDTATFVLHVDDPKFIQDASEIRVRRRDGSEDLYIQEDDGDFLNDYWSLVGHMTQDDRIEKELSAFCYCSPVNCGDEPSGVIRYRNELPGGPVGFKDAEVYAVMTNDARYIAFRNDGEARMSFVNSSSALMDTRLTEDEVKWRFVDSDGNLVCPDGFRFLEKEA